MTSKVSFCMVPNCVEPNNKLLLVQLLPDKQGMFLHKKLVIVSRVLISINTAVKGSDVLLK